MQVPAVSTGEKKGRGMKKCYPCGTPWTGYGPQPRARETCEGCGSYLHCCVNCHHFSHAGSACTLKDTYFIGSRTALNYCEYFKIADSKLKELEDRKARAHTRWEALFGG